MITKNDKVDAPLLNNLGEILGYASVFNIIDSQRDLIEKGAFKQSIARHKAENSIKLLWQHDHNQPIGKILDLYEDDYGLFIKAKLFLNDVAKAKEAYALIQGESINSLSIGFKVQDYNEDVDQNCRVITNLDLWEVSFVTFPANVKAKVINTKRHALSELSSKIQHAINTISIN